VTTLVSIAVRICLRTQYFGAVPLDSCALARCIVPCRGTHTIIVRPHCGSFSFVDAKDHNITSSSILHRLRSSSKGEGSIPLGP
jgi:hypothetical protein